jgi:hypothetical protein
MKPYLLDRKSLTGARVRRPEVRPVTGAEAYDRTLSNAVPSPTDERALPIASYGRVAEG